MTKPPLTQAVGVTPDEVARLGNLFSSKDLRSVQTKLTATATELRNLANGRRRGGGLVANLSAFLTPDQCQLLLDASRLVDSVGQSVTHAKEKRVRTEKEAKRRQDARDALAKQLVARTFPLPTETHEELLETIKAALTLNRARQFYTSYNPSEFNVYIRNELKTPDRLYGHSVEQHRVGNIRSLRYVLICDLTSHLAYDDGSTVEDRLKLLQEKVADAVAQAVLTADESETLRLWKEALLPASNRQEGQA